MTKVKKKNKKFWRNIRPFKIKNGIKILLIGLLCISILSGPTPNKKNNEAFALLPIPCIPCRSCGILDTGPAVLIMETINKNFIWHPRIDGNIEDHLNDEENWIVEDFFEDFWFKGLAELTEFLGAFGMYQVEIVGTFFDAKNYLETKRLYFKLHAEAHKDYHPSDDFCWFGTNARSLASSESRARLNRLALSKQSLERQLGSKHSSSALSADEDRKSRWNQFVTTYCDPKDNNWSEAGTGLDLACDRDGSGPLTAAGATDKNRVNRDIDYTRLIDEPRTLNVDFSDPTSTLPEQEDVIAMSSNLFGNKVLSRGSSLGDLTDQTAKRLYMDLRSIAAKRNVAENSFNAIVSMKSAGTNGDSTAPTQPDVGSYMAAVMKELMPAGTPDNELIAILGENPSYYAQLELLGKKIYQNPDFFASLYDKPANVKRKSVAMKAVELMLDRALFESELRQEMILSIMLSSKLRKQHREINNNLKVD